MPIKITIPKRVHTQFRRVDITISFVLINPNPPHIFDAADVDMEARLRRIGLQNVHQTLPLSSDGKTGFVLGDWIAKYGKINVKVKSREAGLDGKPLNLWKKLQYFLTHRYWY